MQVDISIMEVGVGGRFDATNIVSEPLVTAVTSLGIDHTAVLGKTLPEIASHKAGIFKTGVPAFSSHQPELALPVLQKQADDIGAPIRILKLEEEEQIIPSGIAVGLSGRHQRSNAALAVVVARKVFERFSEKYSDLEIVPKVSDDMPREFMEALEAVTWPGRGQVVIDGDMEWFLDGAHTPDSIEACVRWIDDLDVVDKGIGLIFNCTGGRNVRELLHPLAEWSNRNTAFGKVIFCTNETFKNSGNCSSINACIVVETDDLTNNTTDRDDTLSLQRYLAKEWMGMTNCGSTSVHVVKSVEEAVELSRSFEPSISRVLVCGSLHLLGGVMTVLHLKIS